MLTRHAASAPARIRWRDPEGVLNLQSEAREHAALQWNTTPCGAIDGDEADLRYFLEVERERYRQQPWQHDYFEFGSQAGRRVLEIGVGLGTDLVQFATAGAECHAIDITDRHLLLAAATFVCVVLP